MTRKPRVYIAAPLFNDAERRYNSSLKSLLVDLFDVFLPQEDGGLMAEMISMGINPQAAAREVFDIDIDAIEQADILLFVLDGRTLDEGGCFELGFAYARQKLCVGIQTDSRRLILNHNNPMIEGALQSTFATTNQLRMWAEKFEARWQTRMQLNPVT